MDIDLERLKGLLAEQRRCEEARVGYQEREAHARRTLQAAAKAGEKQAWLAELAGMAQEYRANGEAEAERGRDLEYGVRVEIGRLEKLTGYSLRAQLDLARFLDAQGRDGTPQAQRAVLLPAASVEETLDLCRYLEEKGQYADGVRAARDGWQRFHDRILRSRWADLLERGGARRELIELLTEDMRRSPDDLALMERLAALLLAEDRHAAAYEVMRLALQHRAGGSRLLASFMASLVEAGHTDMAVKLASAYVGEHVREAGRAPGGRMAVRRELAESLRRAHKLEAAVAFLDAQAAEAPGDRDLAGYIVNFLVGSVRSEDRVVRQSALALLRSRRDELVEAQLAGIFAETRGDELRLLVVDSLTTIQGPDALPFLQNALACPARRVRMAAARAMGEIASEGVDEQGSVKLSPTPSSLRSAVRRALLARLKTEEDEGVRRALVEALQKIDPRPRRAWERVAGRRAWADVAPGGRHLPPAKRTGRRAALLGVTLAAVALAGLTLLPIEPSPVGAARESLQGLIGWGGAQVARFRATATPTLAPTATPAPVPTQADRASGRVSEILAADTVRLQVAGQTVTVRYLGIEAPAPGQPGGRPAMDANRSLVIGRMVYLEQGSGATEAGGRWLRYVWLPEGQLASEQLLGMGYGVPAADADDTKYSQRLAEAATKAWQNKAGFWRGGNDVYPMAAVKSAEANIRDAPGTDKPVKLQVTHGTVLAVTGRNATKDWIAVRMAGNVEGWMSLQVVEMTVAVESLPVK